jgi:hypothetical protein
MNGLHVVRAGAVLFAMAASVGAAGAQRPGAPSIEGEWYGIADVRPDSGLPVSVRLSVAMRGDTVRVSLTLPESRQIGLRVPSPYSDSASASYSGGVLRAEFTPDIGFGSSGTWAFRARRNGSVSRGASWVRTVWRAVSPSPATLRR